MGESEEEDDCRGEVVLGECSEEEDDWDDWGGSSRALRRVARSELMLCVVGGIRVR